MIITVVILVTCDKEELTTKQLQASWLKSNAISFNNADPESPEPNLSSLQTIIGDSYCPDSDRDYYSRIMSLTQEYDGIIYFEDTNPASSISF